MDVFDKKQLLQYSGVDTNSGLPRSIVSNGDPPSTSKVQAKQLHHINNPSNMLQYAINVLLDELHVWKTLHTPKQLTGW